MSTANTAMAKKKDASKSEDHAARKPLVIQVRGSQEWRDWVERGAAESGLPLSSLVDQALRMYFKSIGMTESPPRR